jgi:hypothetical protein
VEKAREGSFLIYVVFYRSNKGILERATLPLGLPICCRARRRTPYTYILMIMLSITHSPPSPGMSSSNLSGGFLER